MPTATPRKTASTTPRKRRTRKATAKVQPTIKEVKQMTVETPVRPTPLLKFEDYQKDFNIRLEIHNYEIKELIKDIKWVYEQTKPFVKQGSDYVVSSYKRAFAQ